MTPENSDIPKTARWIADFINRIGFPIFVCIILGYILIVSIKEMKNAYDINSEKVVESVNKNTAAITALRHFLMKRYDD